MYQVIDQMKKECKLEKALKYELIRCEVEYMDKIAEDLEDATPRHKSKILYWQVNILRGSAQSRLIFVKGMNDATISDKERVKERQSEHLENILSQDIFTGKGKEENKKVCDALDVKENLFFEGELVTVLNGLKNNKAPGANSMVNEFLQYYDNEVRNKLLRVLLIQSYSVQ